MEVNSLEEKSIPKEIDFSQVEYIISDWDGVLADSMDAYGDSFGKTLNLRFGTDEKIGKNFFLELSGVPLSVQFKEGAKRFADVNLEDTKDLEEQFWQNLTGLKPSAISGAKDFLIELKKRGLKIIVWSGSRTDVLREKINLLSFSSYVDHAIGNVPGDAELVKGPGLFKIIAEKFGFSPKDLARRTLVVGDGEADMEQGKAIGAKTAGFVRLKTADQLKNAGADFVFEDFDKLLEELKK